MIRRPPRSTLFSLHDALPILMSTRRSRRREEPCGTMALHRHLLRTDPDYASARARSEEHHWQVKRDIASDRKSTRLNSSHANISYAVFCLKKKTHTYLHRLTR